MGLPASCATSGADIAHGPGLWLTWQTQVQPAYAMSGTDLAYAAIGVRACYTISHTKMLYGAMGLCACYAMSGTDRAYGATAAVVSAHADARVIMERSYFPVRYQVRGATSLRACYAMSGTDIW
eukprot:685142-Rhodomonas_salina.3